MRLHLKNIGKLEEANVEINGITVIAGENNTGKSTVSKTLYAIFNSFYNFENNIKSVRIKAFSQNVEKAFDGLYLDFTIETTKITDKLMDMPLEQVDEEYLLDLISQNVVSFWAGFSTENPEADKQFIDDIGDTINFKASEDFIAAIKLNYQRFFKEISDEEVYARILARNLHNMFYSQVSNVFNDAPGFISLQIKDKIFKAKIVGNKALEVSETHSIKTEAIYI